MALGAEHSYSRIPVHGALLPAENLVSRRGMSILTRLTGSAKMSNLAWAARLHSDESIRATEM